MFQKCQTEQSGRQFVAESYKTKTSKQIVQYEMTYNAEFLIIWNMVTPKKQSKAQVDDPNKNKIQVLGNSKCLLRNADLMQCFSTFFWVIRTLAVDI